MHASAASGGDIWIISAGLGLVSGDDIIPSYNLTISPSVEDAIQRRVIPEQTFASPRWWSGLNTALYGTVTPLADLIRKKEDHLFVLPLSRPYAEMVEEDLLSLSTDELSRLRITGLGQDYCPPLRLKPLCMPYDERFDGPDCVNTGTRADFPQRTARHFIEGIVPEAHEADVKTHATMVSSYLEAKRWPSKIKRPTRTDEEIKEIIRVNWNDAGGRSGAMLRVLRDVVEVACEQKRFSQLFKEVKAEKNGSN